MNRRVLSCLVLFGALCQGAHATTTVSKIGAELKGIKSPNGLGLMFGSRYLHYISPTFTVGGAAYTGQLSNGLTGSFSYGGLMAAYQGQISNDFFIELSFLFGGGGGFTTTGGSAGGLTLEPNLNFSFNLGSVVRASVGGGYVWLPSQSQFSGYAAGIRFDFLSGLKSPSHAKNDD